MDMHSVSRKRPSLFIAHQFAHSVILNYHFCLSIRPSVCLPPEEPGIVSKRLYESWNFLPCGRGM